MGLTKSHFIIHTLKILKKYNIVGIAVPLVGLSLILSLLPPYVNAVVFILCVVYMAFIITKKFKSTFKIEAVHIIILKILLKENVMSETATPEIKREKVFIPDEMTVDKIQKKYSLTRAASRRAKKKDSL